MGYDFQELASNATPEIIAHHLISLITVQNLHLHHHPHPDGIRILNVDVLDVDVGDPADVVAGRVDHRHAARVDALGERRGVDGSPAVLIPFLQLAEQFEYGRRVCPALLRKCLHLTHCRYLPDKNSPGWRIKTMRGIFPWREAG